MFKLNKQNWKIKKHANSYFYWMYFVAYVTNFWNGLKKTVDHRCVKQDGINLH